MKSNASKKISTLNVLPTVRLKREAHAESDIVAYPIDTSEKLLRMMDAFSRNNRSQNVSFRRLVNWIKTGERATHYLHPYPAKLLPQIAHFFLAASSLSKKGDLILDSFGGTGTVALETILAGRIPIFAEVNPLAQLIAQVKTNSVPTMRLRKSLAVTKEAYYSKESSVFRVPPVINLHYWYDSKVAAKLCCIKAAIEKVSDKSARKLLLISFSAVCRKVSKADPRLSVPVRLKHKSAIDHKNVWNLFEEQVENNIQRMERFRRMLAGSMSSKLLFAGVNAQRLMSPKSRAKSSSRKLRGNSVAMIITSPPYAGAQKYIRASSLSLGWLDLATTDKLKPLEDASIGREHFPRHLCEDCPKTNVPAANKLIQKVFNINPLRAAIIGSYINEMELALGEMARVLKPGGYLVLVIGNNIVCGHPFKSSEYLASICQGKGLKLRLKLIDEIKSRGLMTKRNKTASVITREWVLVFQKPE